MSLYLDISPGTVAKLSEAARQRGIDVSTLVEKLANDFLPAPNIQGHQAQSAADVIREIGLVGFEPIDLSERVDEYLRATGFGETPS